MDDDLSIVEGMSVLTAAIDRAINLRSRGWHIAFLTLSAFCQRTYGDMRIVNPSTEIVACARFSDVAS